MEKLKRAVIKEELVNLTGNHIKAIVLQQLLYWSERTYDFDKFVEEEFSRATMYSNGQELQENFGIKSCGWIYKTAEELIQETMLQMSPQTMRKYLKELVEEGFIEERSNPKYKWDHTKQYRVDVLHIQKTLLEQGYALEGYKIQLKLRTSKSITCSSKDNACTLKDGGTIPEITTENTTETTIDVENQTSSILNEDQNQNTETIKTSNAGNKEVTLKSEHSGIEDSFIPVWVNSEEEVPTMNDFHLGHLAKESKRKAKMEEHFKNKSIPDLVAWDKERVRKGEKQKSKGGAKAKTSPLNSSVIITRFNELYNSFFSETAPLVEIKHKTLMKKMIEHYGYEYTEAMLLWMFENWAEFKRECKLKSTPNLSILYSFRDYLQEKVRNRVEESEDLHEF